jgi:hypothetical protein
MEFRCEDLPQHGVVLIPPTSPEYDPLLADIQRRIDQPVAGSPPPLPEPMRPRISPENRDTSAILLNRSPKPIALIQQVWTFEDAAGRPSGSSSIGSGWNPSVLLPFGLPEKTLALYGYWHVILPGSKRYLNAQGEQAGDNSDVRPPAGDEIWRGGIAGGRGGGGNRRSAPLAKVTLTLDGVFFADGGFAGPNRKFLWEQVVHTATAHAEVATIARQGHHDGAPAGQILAKITDLTGPVSERPPMPVRPHEASPDSYRAASLGRIAWQIDAQRKHLGDDATVILLLSWNDARPPHFHKL